MSDTYSQMAGEKGKRERDNDKANWKLVNNW